MTATLTLYEFLLARYAERELAARVAADGPGEGHWRPRHRGDEGDEVTDAAGEVVAAGDPPEVAEVIAWHDPAWVLRDVAAKRAVVRIHAPAVADDQVLDWCRGCNWTELREWASRSDDCPTLRALGSIYADHPDYRLEWAPPPPDVSVLRPVT